MATEFLKCDECEARNNTVRHVELFPSEINANLCSACMPNTCKTCEAVHNGPQFYGECAACYADGMAHGGEYETAADLTRFMRDMLMNTTAQDVTDGTCGTMRPCDERAVVKACMGYGMVKS